MPYSDLVTQKEAAAILNRSVSAVSRAIKDGRLEYADPKNRLLHRPGLEMRFARKTRPRIDKPQRKAQKRTGPKGGPATATRSQTQSRRRIGNVSIRSCSGCWKVAPCIGSREPNPHQLMLFCRTIDELRQSG